MSGIDKMKNKAEELSGKGKEAVGDATGDRDLQAEGAAERVEGKVQKGVGALKDAARDVLKN